MSVVELTGFRHCEQALKLPSLKQALYDDGAILMDQVLVTLHGEEHRHRRLAEMKVFRRDFFKQFEQQVIPQIFDDVMAKTASKIDKGAPNNIDLVDLGYHFMVYLALNFAGLDSQDGSQEELETMVSMLRTFGIAATLGQVTDRDVEAARVEIRRTMTEFDERFFTPSVARRQALIQQVESGQLSADQLPMDVLTILLRDEDDLQLVRDMMLRETAFYFLASAHTSVHSLTHAIHHLLAETDEVRKSLEDNRTLVQRYVHESFRLHPSSPVSRRRALADTNLPDGSQVGVDDIVIINLRTANRDEDVFGEAPESFDPSRSIERGVSETGLTFGIGMHACLGKSLAAGQLPVRGREIDESSHQFGTVAWISHALLAAGISSHESDPPELDQAIARETWLRYPVQFAFSGEAV
ncbi:MAG: cytochrome P450 [Limisphaerales bacterium]|jgi:cytochrome P450